MYKWIVILVLFPVMAFSVETEIIAAWHSGENHPYDEDGEMTLPFNEVMSGVTGDIKCKYGILKGSGSNDGTYGVDVLGASREGDGAFEVRNDKNLKKTKGQILITIENNERDKISVDALCFDFLPRQINASQKAPNKIVVKYVKGGLPFEGKTIFESPIITSESSGNHSDYEDFMIDLTAFGSTKLGKKSAQFAIFVQGGDNDNLSSLIDNIALVSYVTAPSASTSKSSSSSEPEVGLKPFSLDDNNEPETVTDKPAVVAKKPVVVAAKPTVVAAKPVAVKSSAAKSPTTEDDKKNGEDEPLVLAKPLKIGKEPSVVTPPLAAKSPTTKGDKKDGEGEPLVLAKPLDVSKESVVEPPPLVESKIADGDKKSASDEPVAFITPLHVGKKDPVVEPPPVVEAPPVVKQPVAEKPPAVAVVKEPVIEPPAIVVAEPPVVVEPPAVEIPAVVQAQTKETASQTQEDPDSKRLKIPVLSVGVFLLLLLLRPWKSE